MSTEIGLVADVGRQSVRFAVSGGREGLEPRGVAHFRTSEHPTFTDALMAYIQHAGLGGAPIASAFALAGAVHGKSVNLTGSRWYVSLPGIAAVLRRPPIALNECAATALSLMRLQDADFHVIRGSVIGSPKPGGCYLVVSPGTGLGVSALVTSNGRLVPVQSEAAHMRYNALSMIDDTILAYITRKLQLLTNETVLSANGLSVMYAALSGNDALLRPEAVTRAAASNDSRAAAAVAAFASALVLLIGELVLAFGAWDGVYLTGPVVRSMPRLLGEAAVGPSTRRRSSLQQKAHAVPISIVGRGGLELIGASVALLDAAQHSVTALR